MAASVLNYKLETDLTTLRSFVAIVEEGGFSAAARRVNRTQSAVSVQIAKLEERLNTRLLERDTRPVTVTPSGEAFLTHTRLDGRLVLRCAIGNLKTTPRHVRGVWDLLRDAASRELA